jgi:hypothetical protein
MFIIEELDGMCGSLFVKEKCVLIKLIYESKSKALIE